MMYASTLGLIPPRDVGDWCTVHESGAQSPSLSLKDEDEDSIPTNLKLVIILSGKRKSGKDHISTLITNYIGYHRMQHLAVLRIAATIKKEFARQNQTRNNKLDFTRLLSSGGYKENFAVLKWSERYKQKNDLNCFLKQTIREQKAKDKAVWILNDAKQPSDLEYFEDDSVFAATKVIKLRLEASFDARKSRGWRFVEGIDDTDIECGLDLHDDWSYVIENDFNDGKRELVEALQPIFREIDTALAEYA